MKRVIVFVLLINIIYVPNILSFIRDDCLCLCPCFSINGKWLWQDNSIVICYPSDMDHGTCWSTNGQHGKWRELTKGGYEVEWTTSQSPKILSVDTVYVVDDGTKLIGSNDKKESIQALKMKLKQEDKTEITKGVKSFTEVKALGEIEVIDKIEALKEVKLPEEDEVRAHEDVEIPHEFEFKPEPPKRDKIIEADIPPEEDVIYPEYGNMVNEDDQPEEFEYPIEEETTPPVEEFKLPEEIKGKLKFKSPEKANILEGIKNQLK